ncbi:MAG: hypothetical protein SFU99_20450 [Saprospiraceae bacterium]|nr:hypothetical protein [Saprospiraceae bacterium]
MKKIWNFILPLIAIAFVCAMCEDDDNEPMVELPSVIKDYINQNYGDYKIEASELDTLCTGAIVYDVELEGKKDKEMVLIFDTEGNLLYTEAEIKVNELPAGVKNSISNAYTNYEIKEAERLDLTDGTKQYEVEIKKDQTTMEVLLNANGTVICAQEEKDDDD